MDGHFVPNLAIGAPIVQSLRRVTRLPLEAHLMISHPDSFLDEFAEAGSTSFLVHREGNNNLHRTVQRMKALGKCAGVAINPATPASVLEEILPDLEVLVMTVNPGFGHQHFLESTLPKIRRVAQMIERIKPDCELEVDGELMRRLLQWQSQQEPMSWSQVRQYLVLTKTCRPQWNGSVTQRRR